MLRGWTSRFLPLVLHGLCNPTPILRVHGIATYARFSMLKKLNFNPVPGFHGLTSRSNPGLKTVPKYANYSKPEFNHNTTIIQSKE